jgi:hypothetical protein
MAVLTKTQLEHAKSRVAAAKDAYVHRQMAALGEKPDVVEFDDEQREAMIRTGVAVLKPNNSWGRSNYCSDPFNYFTFPDSPALKEQRQKRKAWEEAATGINRKAHDIASSLLDELIMAPDGVAALKRIADAFA